MASVLKRCRHPRDQWDECLCQWYVRFKRGGKDKYLSGGGSRSEAERVRSLHAQTPPPLREISRAPGLSLPDQNGSSWVYFVAGAGLVKIGLTTDIVERMAMLQAASPVALTLMLVVDGGREVERLYHAMFDPYRRHGEWFALPVGWENDERLVQVAA